MCSATLIAKDIILTAAHCVQSGMQVYLGSELRNSTRIPVSQAIIHPSWKNRGSQVAPYDIAVAKLSSPITSKKPAILSTALLQRNESLMIAGYGNDGNYRYGSLRFTQVSLTSRDRYGRVNTLGQSNRGACDGDSGGPLFVRRQGGWQLAGTLSGGTRCGAGNLYTETASFNEFISESVAELGGSLGDGSDDDRQEPDDSDPTDDIEAKFSIVDEKLDGKTLTVDFTVSGELKDCVVVMEGFYRGWFGYYSAGERSFTGDNLEPGNTYTVSGRFDQQPNRYSFQLTCNQQSIAENE